MAKPINRTAQRVSIPFSYSQSTMVINTLFTIPSLLNCCGTAAELLTWLTCSPWIASDPIRTLHHLLQVGGRPHGSRLSLARASRCPSRKAGRSLVRGHEHRSAAEEPSRQTASGP
jgi:hypothetical protein